MKKCTQCGKRKSLNLFYVDVNQNDGHKDECKVCNTLRSTKYYYAHQKRIQAQLRRYALDHKPLMREIRARGRRRRYALVVRAKSKPCMDCGQSFIPFVMDLDHVRGKKLFALSACRTRPISAVQKEIAKCDTVCSNCHRIRTWNRTNRSKL